MKSTSLLVILAGLLAAGTANADPPPKAAKTFQVPYRLTNTLHVLVRAKINGQGPFNFIVDTGAPMLVVSAPVGKKLGLKADKSGWTTLERFEIEGGVVQTKTKCRVETPFQIEGMNGMGLAGAELHGMMGYTVLARYRMEFDFTRDKMAWTPLDYSPPSPKKISGKQAPAGGLEIVGAVMKLFGLLSGRSAAPEHLPRGYLGIQLTEDKDGITIVEAVLAKTPAARAGLRAGDRIERIEGWKVRSLTDAYRLTARIIAGQTVSLIIRRADQKRTITVTAGEGL